MNSLCPQLRTYLRLGVLNLARVAAYRVGLRLGLHSVQQLVAPVPHPPFFRPGGVRTRKVKPNREWDHCLWYFGWYPYNMPDGSPPDWFRNPFSDQIQPDATQVWWKISDFGSGDIKGLWELSRMDWAVAWATTAAQGDTAALERLNLWLADWTQQNQPYKGPNWKCGQEASIRVLHLVTAAWVLGQADSPEQGLVNLVSTHLQRIAPTISYAIGQQNNHGTSEAAALFIGGSFLGDSDPRAAKWERTGRHWLERLAATLIEPDGSFSQYSVTYHRVMLDTYSLAEAWRRKSDLPAFSERLNEHLAAATNWLWSMMDTHTGDAPNIGANDGARLLQLTGSNYRDFRPSVQLAAALFKNVDAFGPGDWVSPLHWLEVTAGTSVVLRGSQSFDLGGFHTLRNGSSMAVLRYPRFRFRPSQADALHLDFWHNGVNLLRDAGTFSYNVEGAEWFSGTAAHNTIEFDGRDQMPRLRRFLFSEWIKAVGVETVCDDGKRLKAAACIDVRGVRHNREVTLSADTLVCRDTVSGNFGEAILRWRLAPCEWIIKSDSILSESCAIFIEIDGVLVTPTLSDTMESRFYLHKERIPEVSVKVARPGEFVTRVAF